MSYLSDYSGAQVEEAIGKALNPDATPTEGSANLVQSGGVASAVGAVQNTVSRRNLLDNPWFTVNQRGLTSYAWNGIQYSVDRWKWDTISTAPLEVQSDGVNLNGSALTVGSPYIRQIIDNPTAYRGKTMTFSAIVSAVSGVPYNGFLRVYSGAGNAWGVYFGTDAGLWTVTFTVPSDATAFVCDIGAYTGKTVKVAAAKLELGSVSTLANDAPPCFAEELAKCQRYAFVPQIPSGSQYLAWGFNLGNSASSTVNALVQLPVVMRATPTASGSLHSIRGNGVNVASSITIGTPLVMAGNNLIIPINTSSSFSALTTGWGVLFSSLVLSADL